jgi:hypothetical protein
MVDACSTPQGARIGFSPWAGHEMNSYLKGRMTMLYTIAVVLLLVWLLGIAGTFTIGPLIHVLLIVALVLFVVGLLSGRRSLA